MLGNIVRHHTFISCFSVGTVRVTNAPLNKSINYSITAQFGYDALLSTTYLTMHQKALTFNVVMSHPARALPPATNWNE